MVLPLYTLGQCTASDDFAIHFCFQAVSKAGENNSHADRGPPTPGQGHIPLFCTLFRNTLPTPVPGRRSGLSSHSSAIPLVPLKLLQLHQRVPRPEHHHENMDMADFASCPVVLAGLKAPSWGGKWVLIDLTLLQGASRGGDEIGGWGGGRSWSESPPLIQLPCCFLFSFSSGPGVVAFLLPSPLGWEGLRLWSV